MICMHYGRELKNYISLTMNRGHAVAQLLDSLHYKSEGYGFDSPVFPYCGFGIDSACNINEYLNTSWRVKVAGA